MNNKKLPALVRGKWIILLLLLYNCWLREYSEKVEEDSIKKQGDINCLKYEDKLTIVEEEPGISIGEVNVPAGSKTSGKIRVSVLDYQLNIDQDYQKSLTVVLMIEKELYITTPDERELPLDFAYRLQKNIPLKQCNWEEEMFNNSICQIEVISANSNLSLNPSLAGEEASIDDKIEIRLQLTLLSRDIVKKRRNLKPIPFWGV